MWKNYLFGVSPSMKSDTEHIFTIHEGLQHKLCKITIIVDGCNNFLGVVHSTGFQIKYN